MTNRAFRSVARMQYPLIAETGMKLRGTVTPSAPWWSNRDAVGNKRRVAVQKVGPAANSPDARRITSTGRPSNLRKLPGNIESCTLQEPPAKSLTGLENQPFTQTNCFSLATTSTRSACWAITWSMSL